MSSPSCAFLVLSPLPPPPRPARPPPRPPASPPLPLAPPLPSAACQGALLGEGRELGAGEALALCREPSCGTGEAPPLPLPLTSALPPLPPWPTGMR